MKGLLLCVLLVCSAAPAFAVNTESRVRFRRDPGFFDTGRMQCIQWVNPAAPDTDVVASAVLLDSAAAGTHTFTTAQKAAFDASGHDGWARTVSVDIGSWADSNNDIAAGTVTVYGTNVLNETVSQAFTITNNTSNSQQGTVAFHTLTYFTYTAMDDDSVGVSIGIGTKLGLWNTLPLDSMVLAWNGATADADAAITADDDEIEKNVIDFTTDPTGTTDFGVLYWIPPFAVVSTEIISGKY